MAKSKLNTIKKAVYKWAREDKVDEDLFAHWKDEKVDENQYKKYKIQMMGGE